MAEFKELVDIDNLIDKIASKKLEVGFFEHSAYEDGTLVAEVASVHEFGSVKGNIPERPFFNPAMEENEETYAQVMAIGFRRVMEGSKTTEEVLNGLGEFVVGDIKTSIRAVNSLFLSEKTLEARAKKHYAEEFSDEPLVDTGLLLKEVDYEVSDV